MYGQTYWQHTVVIANGSSALCSGLNLRLKNISPCDHEKADTRMLLRDAVLNGRQTKQPIRTNDNEVLVLVLVSSTSQH